MKTVTISQAVQTSLEVEEALARERYLAKAAECPTLIEWADHSIKGRPLRMDQYKHALGCNACQKTQRQLQPQPAKVQIDWPARAAATVPGQRNRFLPVVLATDEDALVELTHGPFLSGKGRLSLTLNVVRPTFTREELPVQLKLVIWPEDTALHTFELPALRGQQLTVQLPKDLLEQERWQKIERIWPTLEPDELPLRCVLEAGCNGLADAEGDSHKLVERWKVPPTAAVPRVRNRFLPAVPATADFGDAGTDDCAWIELTHGPFLSTKGRLILTINVVRPSFMLEEFPVQLQLVAWPEMTLLYTFKLLEQRAQQLTVQLPENQLERWRNIEKTWPNLPPKELPLRCVLGAAATAWVK